MDRDSKIINFIFGLFLSFLIASTSADDGVTGNCDVDMWYEAMNRTEGVFLKSMTPGQKMIKEQIEKLVTPVGKTSRAMKMPCSMLYKFTTILNPDMDTTKKEVLFMFIKSDDTKVKGGDDGENKIKGPADMKGNDDKKRKEESSDTTSGEKKEEEESSNEKDGEEKEKEDSSDKNNDENIETKESFDKKDDEKNDSLDKKDEEKNEKEDSSDKKDEEEIEMEISSDKKDDGKNEKEDSLDKKDDESEEKDENEDKKDDVDKENEQLPDQKGDSNEEKEELSDKKDDKKKDKEESSDEKVDKKKEKEESSDKKEDKNKDKEDSSDKKVDKKKEKEESSDKKEDKNREGNSETVESPEKDPDEKKAEKSEEGPSVLVGADATDMTDFDDTETEESIYDTPKTDPVKEDNVVEGEEGESEKKTGKKLSDAVEEMLSDANFCYSLIYYLHMFYLKESELKEMTPGNSLMEKVTRECLMCGVNPAFDWLCAQLTSIHKLYTSDINDDLKKTEQVMVEKDKEEKRGFMERIADTIDDLLDFTKSTPDNKEEKKTTDENEKLGPTEDMKDAKKLDVEGETEEIRTQTRAAGAATETDAQALLREEKLRIIEQKKIRELSEALEHTEVRMSEKTQVHERKIAQLEIEILKVQNKLLTATLNKSNDTATFSKLENYIIKLENEILRMNISFFNLKKENENLKKKSQQFLMLEDKQAKQKEQERSKSLEVLQKQQDRIMQLSSMLNGQNSMMSELRNRSSQLEEENKTLRDMMAKQNLVMSEVLSKLEKVESNALVTSQQISDLKSSSMSKTRISGSVPEGLNSKVTKSKRGPENKYRRESNQMTGQNCHNLTSQKGCVYVSMLKGQCCSHQRPEVPYGDSNPKRREAAGKHGHIETRDTEKGDTGESGSEAKKCGEHSNNEMEADMLKAIEVELQKEGAKRAKEVEAEKSKESAVLKAKEAEAVKAKEAQAQAQTTKDKEAAVQKAKEVEAAKVREAIAAAKKAKEAEEQEAKEAWVKKAKEAEDKKAKKAKNAETKNAKDAAAKEAEDEIDKQAKEAKSTKEAAIKKRKETVAEKEKEKEAKAQKEKETEAQRAKEVETRRAKEADVQKAKEAEVQKEKEAETQRAKDAEFQRAKEAQAKKMKEAEVQKEKEAEVRKAKETEAQKKAGENAKPPEATSAINSPAIVNGERILLYHKELTSGMKDCFAHFVNGKKRDSGFQIHPHGLKGQSEKVWCDMTSGGWTVIQKRQSGTLDFNKSWQQYKEGFGDVFGEHWIGNDLIHLLTNQDKYSLRIDLMDWQRNKVYILYEDFWIDSEAEGYRLHVGGYSGTVGDALAKHDGRKFSTKDVDNDEVGSHVKQFKDWDGSCAKRFSGAWWFYKCYQSNLNGKYYRGGEVPGKKFDGVAWKPWKGPKYSLKRVEMKIRPKDASEVILR